MYKVDDKVMINPDWEKRYPNEDDYGISFWEEYIGSCFTVIRISDGNYILKEDGMKFHWPPYMLMSPKNSIAYELSRRVNND